MIREQAGIVGTDEVRDAYRAQAASVIGMLGTSVGPGDPNRAVIDEWAEGIDGSILDVGSGTGRWAGYLAGRGHDVVGIDPVERFVRIARRDHPSVPFCVAGVDDLAGSAERWSGIFAWYSLIHMDPDSLRRALSILRRILREDGSILLSFFAGPRVEPFNHPVAPAYRWSMTAMSEALDDAGFAVVTRRGGHQGPTASPHAVVTAQAA